MAALGNVMFVFSQTIFKTGQIALDLSHIGTLIAAVYGGPWTGLLAGLLVGVGPGFYFGYLGGTLGLLGLIGLPIGKALTGFTVGHLARFFKIENTKYASWKIVLVTLLGYIPEAIFTVVFFEVFVVILLPDVAAYLGPMQAFVISIMIKAWLEMAILSFIMGALVGNNGFSTFMRQNFISLSKRSK
jgi:hypothetical protein